MGLGFSILQIDFQNIFALNVTFIGHNKNYQERNPTEIIHMGLFLEKQTNKKQRKTKTKHNKQISKTNQKTNQKAKYTKDKGGLFGQINSRRLLDLLNTILISREGKLSTREKSKAYVETDLFSLFQSNTTQIGLYATARKQREWAEAHTQITQQILPSLSLPLQS